MGFVIIFARKFNYSGKIFACGADRLRRCEKLEFRPESNLTKAKKTNSWPFGRGDLPWMYCIPFLYVLGGGVGLKSVDTTLTVHCPKIEVFFNFRMNNVPQLRLHLALW